VAERAPEPRTGGIQEPPSTPEGINHSRSLTIFTNPSKLESNSTFGRETLQISLEEIRLNSYNPNAMDSATFKALLRDMSKGGPDAIDPILVRARPRLNSPAWSRSQRTLKVRWNPTPI